MNHNNFHLICILASVTTMVLQGNTIVCPTFAANRALPTYHPHYCNFTACSGELAVGNCECSGSQLIKLFDEYGDSVMQTTDGCGLSCALFFYDVPNGCHSYSLLVECYDSNCELAAQVTGTNVSFPQQVTNVVTVQCPMYFGNVNEQIASTCQFEACEGFLEVGDCDLDVCFGQRALELYDSSGVQLAGGNQSCAYYPACTPLTYNVPPGCHSYTLKQGCSGSFHCVGEMKITGNNATVTSQPPVMQSVDCPFFSVGAGNAMICNFTACGGPVYIGSCEEECGVGNHQYLLQDREDSSDILLSVLCESYRDCETYVVVAPDECRNYSLVQKCSEDWYCYGQTKLTGSSVALLSPPGPAAPTGQNTVLCPHFVGSNTMDGDVRVNCNFTATSGPLLIECGDSCAGMYLPNLYDDQGIEVATCFSMIGCSVLVYHVPEDPAGRAMQRSYRLEQGCRVWAECGGQASITGSNVSLAADSQVQPGVSYSSQQCGVYSTYNTAAATQNYAMCNITACEGPLTIDACNDFCTGYQFIRLQDSSTGAVVATDTGCLGTLCSLLTFTVPAGCHDYTLIEGCYDDYTCAGRMTVTANQLQMRGNSYPRSSLNRPLLCPAYEAVNTRNAKTKTVACVFEACEGELLISGCLAGSCHGDQMLRLLDSSGEEVAEGDDGCGSCTHFTYQVPAGCHNFTLMQGCYNKEACGGIVGLQGNMALMLEDGDNAVGHIPTLTDTPTESPTTTDCSTYFQLYLTSGGVSSGLCILADLVTANYDEAVEFCSSKSSQLPKIETLTYNDFIYTLTDHDQWVGLRYDNASAQHLWTTDGTPPNFTNWCPDQPNLEHGLCVRMSDRSSSNCAPGQWRSSACEDSLQITCVALPLSYRHPTMAPSSKEDAGDDTAQQIPPAVVYTLLIVAGICGIYGFRLLKAKWQKHSKVYTADSAAAKEEEGKEQELVTPPANTTTLP